MSLHLAEIAKAVDRGAHAVLLMDQAGWHLSQKLVVPPSITILPLPPKCPELKSAATAFLLKNSNLSRGAVGFTAGSRSAIIPFRAKARRVRNT